ncbi:MAG: hypothetical protein J0H57_10700 [Rhodospirillales bacterium]|nr:hypothetical protein [Rhodospirillales bacterium]
MSGAGFSDPVVTIHILRGECLQCPRCRKYDLDCGKIKQFPDLRLRCADAVQSMIDSGADPYGQPKDWTGWIECHEAAHAGSPVRSMETTHKIGRFDLVYMPEDVTRPCQSLFLVNA